MINEHQVMHTSDWFLLNRLTIEDFVRWRSMSGRPLTEPQERELRAADKLRRETYAGMKRKENHD